MEHLNEGNSHSNNNDPTPAYSYMITEESINRLRGLKDELFRIETDTTNKTMEHNNIPIPRVPLWLRENKAYSECFDPAVVSIGPYHHGKPKLTRIEKLKIISARQFVTDCKSSMGDIYKKLEPLTSQAKMYYDDSIKAKFNLRDEAFTVMMLLDGCFILDFIQQVVFDRQEWMLMTLGTNIPSIASGAWMLMTLGNDVPLISRDLFLLENQLPYLILKELMEYHHLACEKNQWYKDWKELLDCDRCLESMVYSYITSEIGKTYGMRWFSNHINPEIGKNRMPSSPSAGQNCDPKMPSSPSAVQNHDQTMRSLPSPSAVQNHDQTMRSLPSPLPSPSAVQNHDQTMRSLPSPSAVQNHDQTMRSLPSPSAVQNHDQTMRSLPCILDLFRAQLLSTFSRFQSRKEPRERRERREPRERLKRSYPPVKELLGMGITFKRKNSICLCDVEFRSHLLSGELLLPQIEINHYTKDRFLNLIAYELSYDIPESSDDNCLFVIPRHAFIAFICFLDTLIDHADDVKVLRSKGIICNYLGSDEEVANLVNQLATGLNLEPSAYSEVVHEIQSHLQEKWRVYIGEIMHTYFRSPLTTIALIVAGCVVLLTSIQTFFTIFPR